MWTRTQHWPYLRLRRVDPDRYAAGSEQAADSRAADLSDESIEREFTVILGLE